ncbi:MAG: DNA repair ATPase [Bacteroidia bacterium]
MSTPQNIQLENSTYEIVKKRLQAQADELRQRLQKLNDLRREVFGSRDLVLLANDRITTENNCIPRDMVAMGNHFLFGYNVHIGLRTEIKLADVFSIYRFDPSSRSFQQEGLTLINDQKFDEEFRNLYKYYKSTVFSKFAVIGPYLFMVFQIGKSNSDIKTFKWAIEEDSLTYLGNRFDHEFRFPDQHEFAWVKATREMHRRGQHPHVSIMDRVFVETVGGDLTIKVEDNTDDGKGIYGEPVDNKDQTLDDADIYFADLGNLIALKIRPYQEKNWRYIIFNQKMQEAVRVDSIEKACVRLPDDQGIIFSNGYYLQTGEYKIFDNIVQDLQFEKRINSSNGEDYLFTFYDQEAGVYALLPYNLVEQKVETPILCSGFTIFPNGELCYFRAESEASRNHLVQVWQTPYGKVQKEANAEANAYVFKVGNKDLVRGMAECNGLLTLISRDQYGDLYTGHSEKNQLTFSIPITGLNTRITQD